MKKTDLGRKITCTECGAKFYDLNRSPVICPKCHKSIEFLKKTKNKKSEDEETIIEPKTKATKKANLENDMDSMETIDDDVEDNILEESSNIEDDDEALGSVIVNMDNEKDNNP